MSTCQILYLTCTPSEQAGRCNNHIGQLFNDITTLKSILLLAKSYCHKVCREPKIKSCVNYAFENFESLFLRFSSFLNNIFANRRILQTIVGKILRKLKRDAKKLHFHSQNNIQILCTYHDLFQDNFFLFL